MIFLFNERINEKIPVSSVICLMTHSRERKNRRKRRKKYEQRVLYSQAISSLLDRSLTLRSKNPELAKDYYLSARQMGMRGRQHLSKGYRIFFCKSCNYPIQASTVRIRLNSQKKLIHYSCLRCGHSHRYGYRK